MSYRTGLDEYSDEEIVREYQNRMTLLEAGVCTYCSKPFAECNCKMKNVKGMAKGVEKFLGYPMHNLRSVNR